MLKLIKSFVAFTTAIVIMASVFVPSSAKVSANFSDVKQGQDGYKEITFLAEREVIKGYETGLFNPYQPITRGQVAKLLTRELELKIPNKLNVFPDVPANHKDQELVKAVAAVADAEIFTGKNNGTFGPNEPLTRQQMAKVLVNAFELYLLSPTYYHEIDYKDRRNISNDLYDYVEIMTAFGIAKGNNSYFMPTAKTNRKQFAQFLYRTLAGYGEVDNFLQKLELVDGAFYVTNRPGVIGFDVFDFIGEQGEYINLFNKKGLRISDDKGYFHPDGTLKGIYDAQGISEIGTVNVTITDQFGKQFGSFQVEVKAADEFYQILDGTLVDERGNEASTLIVGGRYQFEVLDALTNAFPYTDYSANPIKDFSLALFPGITFESSNQNVMTVDKNGIVTMIAPGLAELIVTFNDSMFILELDVE